MALHLRNKHNFTGPRSREIVKEAKLVKDMNWTAPNIASPVACDDDDSISHPRLRVKTHFLIH